MLNLKLQRRTKGKSGSTCTSQSISASNRRRQRRHSSMKHRTDTHRQIPSSATSIGAAAPTRVAGQIRRRAPTGFKLSKKPNLKDISKSRRPRTKRKNSPQRGACLSDKLGQRLKKCGCEKAKEPSRKRFSTARQTSFWTGSSVCPPSWVQTRSRQMS